MLVLVIVEFNSNEGTVSFYETPHCYPIHDKFNKEGAWTYLMAPHIVYPNIRRVPNSN